MIYIGHHLLKQNRFYLGYFKKIIIIEVNI